MKWLKRLFQWNKRRTWKRIHRIQRMMQWQIAENCKDLQKYREIFLRELEAFAIIKNNVQPYGLYPNRQPAYIYVEVPEFVMRLLSRREPVVQAIADELCATVVAQFRMELARYEL